MRLWSLHPRFLDSQGLVALWREALLAQKVLAGRTKGYKHHPQLSRFRKTSDPLASIGLYLHHVSEEAVNRGYLFNVSKILKLPRRASRIKVTRGQIAYECRHLLAKLARRDPTRYSRWKARKSLPVHPSFGVVAGGVAEWEKV